MKNILLIFVFGIVLASLVIQTGCYYDNEEDLYPFKEMCDTSAVTLSGVIKPILQPNCYSCHSAAASGAAGAGINLEDYGNLKGWADNGKLLCAVEHGDNCSPMPKGGKLRECDILKIAAWISAGALDN